MDRDAGCGQQVPHCVVEVLAVLDDLQCPVWILAPRRLLLFPALLLSHISPGGLAQSLSQAGPKVSSAQGGRVSALREWSLEKHLPQLSAFLLP